MATSDLLKLANLLPLSNASSEVWKFYGFKNDGGKIVDGDKVYCVICEPHRQLKYCGNTTNLFSHLKNKHPRVYSNLQKPKQSTEASSSCSSKPPQYQTYGFKLFQKSF